MPTVDIKMQDGSTKQLSYPEGWTKDQVRNAIKKHYDKIVSKPSESESNEPLKPKEETGFGGIGEDISKSLMSAYPALEEMIKSIPGGLKKAGRYAASESPLETFGNLGAGGVEGASQLLSAPQIFARYLSNKFPNVKMLEGAKKPSFYEALLDFEKKHGLSSKNEDEAAIRNIGNLIFGGKGLTKIGSMPGRVAAISAQQAGAGGDPLHAALMSLLGEKAAKTGAGAINRAAEMNEPVNQPIDIFGNINPTANIQNMPTSPGYMETISNIPKAASNLASMIPSAIKQAPESLGSGAASVLEKVADYGSKIPMGAEVLQPTMGALASYIKHLSVSPETMAQRKLFGDISSQDLPQIKERMDAAKRLGISFLTPGEALLSPFQTAKEANVGRTTGGAKLLYSKGKERAGTEEKAIDSLLDTVYDEKSLSPQKQAAYESVMDQTVPSEFMDKWKQEPIVDWAIKQMESKPTYKSELKNVPKDSFKYWDIVKRVIADLEKGEAKGMQGFSSNAATKVRNRMVDEMDELQPNYEQARNIAEREFTRKDLESVFDKKSMTLNNFWSFLKSDKAFDKMMRKLAPFPEAQQKLKDMRLLSNQLIPFDDSIRTAYKLEKTGMTKDRNKLDALKRDLDERFGTEHDVAAVNLMTNPDWLQMLQQYLRENRK